MWFIKSVSKAVNKALTVVKLIKVVTIENLGMRISIVDRTPLNDDDNNNNNNNIII